MDDILNRVSQSGIISIDLDEYFPPYPVVGFDVKDWLWQGLILKEKDFREKLDSFDWTQYQGAAVTVYCSADAIVPYWAYMLIVVKLQPYAHEIAFGTSQEYLSAYYSRILAGLDPEDYKDKRIVVKGCGDKPVPVSAYMDITRILAPYARSIMYGEPCSTVPVYKRSSQK